MYYSKLIMRVLNKSFFSVAPRNETILMRSVTNNLSKYYFCSLPSLQKKKETLSESRSEDLSTPNLPKKPKKPATSFIQFFLSSRSTLLQENPTHDNRELIKHAAKLWKKIDEETKVQYQIKYYNELEKYLDEVEKYNSNLTEEQVKELQKLEIRNKENRIRKKIKEKCNELEKPKRPLNAFTSYMVSRKNDLKKTKANIYCHSLAMEWNELPENEKNKFRQKSKEHQKEYRQKLAEWKERVGPLNIMHIMKTKNYKEAMQLLEENSMEDPILSLKEEKKKEES